MLQLHSITVALGSLSGGDCVTLYVKDPQWQDAVYVAVGAEASGAVGRGTSVDFEVDMLRGCLSRGREVVQKRT